MTWNRGQLNTAMLVACCAGLMIASTGCSTLSSLGLPFGGSANEILESARNISEAPGQSLLVPKELAKLPLANYIVEIGDSILIEPVRFDATIRLPGDQIVKPDGQISLGEFGRYSVADKTIEQIQLEVQSIIDNDIRQDLEVAYEIERRKRSESVAPENTAGEQDTDLLLLTDDEDDVEKRRAHERRIQDSIRQNEVSARLVNWESKRIYVLGEVNSPGSFTCSGTQTVLDAIIEAGGLSSKSNRHQIIVSRPTRCSEGRIVMAICYDQIVQLGDASTNYQLLPGDRVFVPSLTFCDDLMKSFGFRKGDRCPRCADCPRACNLPAGCD